MPYKTAPLSAPSASSSAIGCLLRARGALLVVGSAGVGFLGWLVLSILADDLRKSPEHAKRVDDFALWMIDHRMVVPWVVIPVAIAGLLTLLQRRESRMTRATFWMIISLGTLWLAAIFIAVLVTFIMFLAPLYRYENIG